MNSTSKRSHPNQQLLERLKPQLKTLPSVMVSSCLMGENVRYDGKHKRQEPLQTLFSDLLRLEAFCPEVAAGMGVPREPIHWVECAQGEQRIEQVTEPKRQYQQALQRACEHQLADTMPLDGAIVKARSPSCGLGNTPVVSEQGKLLSKIDGLWVQNLKTKHPSVLMTDESLFNREADSLWFIALLYLQQLARQGDFPSSKALHSLSLTAPNHHRRSTYQQLSLLIDKH
ncbi:MAG: DUF523 domain-containing protein [Cellvibrionaceae bacterium]